MLILNKRKTDRYYWVKTNGYHASHTPMYLNTDNQWRIEINDTTLFISDYKLELLYGRGCVIREVDFNADLNSAPKQNAFLPHLVSTDNSHAVFYVNTAINMAMLNGMLVPMKDTQGALFFHDKTH